MIRTAVAASLAAALLSYPALALEPPPIVRSETASAVEVRDVAERDGAVTGTVVNHENVVIRNVRLLVQYEWRWTDERNPGDDPPGWGGFHVMSGQIEPGQSAAFEVRPPTPPERRPDGYYVINAKVMGFSKVSTITVFPTPSPQ